MFNAIRLNPNIANRILLLLSDLNGLIAGYIDIAMNELCHWVFMHKISRIRINNHFTFCPDGLYFSEWRFSVFEWIVLKKYRCELWQLLLNMCELTNFNNYFSMIYVESQDESNRSMPSITPNLRWHQHNFNLVSWCILSHHVCKFLPSRQPQSVRYLLFLKLPPCAFNID